jgi:hypothetical protein
VGILVHGRGHLIRNNQVVATGSTLYGTVIGIDVQGDGPRVLNNDVIDTQAPGSGATAVGIFFSSTSGALVVKNRITNADGD